MCIKIIPFIRTNTDDIISSVLVLNYYARQYTTSYWEY